jgi:hypothetical protein
MYNDAHFNSKDGMLTSVWGPALWHTLHTMSFNYPVNPTSEQKKHYSNFIISLKYVLPCGACRKNLIKNLVECPLTSHALSNRNYFSRWLYRLHEKVNTMLGKKSGLTYNIVRDRYENFRARCLQKGGPKKIEDGCVDPVYGVKTKCVINIVPKNAPGKTFNIDKRCNVAFYK